MNWPLLRNSLANQYHEQPQVVAKIDHALSSVRSGLEQLAALGHLMHLCEGAAPVAKEWPRMVYSLSHPRGYLCLCEQDFVLLGPGWFNTLDEAKHADGMGAQFRRGGIFPKAGLPAVVE